ncbi:phage head closure protein [Paraburkholderia sp. J67]|uniref:phage head closure protein n=1 Tax=Paraburkholderia sp. J67 TaxID=2805435 RepID=UPI002ABD2D6E|nr:phage head closure protein [Paraburkholderia sp. J67]
MATTTRGMRAGPLRHRVRLQSPIMHVSHEDGEAVVERWKDVAKVWASIEPLSGREYLASLEFRSGLTTRIRIRWRDDVTAAMRVLHGRTTYAIDAVLPGYAGRAELQLMCGSGVITDGGQP